MDLETLYKGIDLKHEIEDIQGQLREIGKENNYPNEVFLLKKNRYMKGVIVPEQLQGVFLDSLKGYYTKRLEDAISQLKEL